MKRRHADRLGWQRVLERRFEMVQVSSLQFTGTIALLRIDRVSAPLWVEMEGRQYCLADAGYCWLQHYPDGANYALTTMFDAAGSVVQWYIDICAGLGVDDRGIPWADDLYLDIVILPPDTVLILDEDELDDALAASVITSQQHSFAWRETRRLLALIAAHQMSLLELAPLHLQRYFET